MRERKEELEQQHTCDTPKEQVKYIDLDEEQYPLKVK